MKKFEKGLYIISTPIGNRYDITLRAIAILKNSDVIVCEDTRVTKNLFKLLELDFKDKKWLTYNDYKSDIRRNKIKKALDLNEIVSMVSDAGTPLISDPGYKLINYIREKGYKIFSIPGPCAAISSLVISGLKTDKFCFLGFLPRNKNKYVSILRNYSSLKSTIIIYEKATRINFLLNTLSSNFSTFKLVIVKELTKIYEEVIFIDSKNVHTYIEKNVKLRGELTIIIEILKDIDIIFSNKVLLIELKKLKPSQVSAMLSKKSTESREKIYKRCIELIKNENKKN